MRLGLTGKFKHIIKYYRYLRCQLDEKYYPMNRSKIIGLGFQVPDNVVSNFDLEEMMETTDEWIQTRSGIKERRWATEDVATSDLALEASKKQVKWQAFLLRILILLS